MCWNISVLESVSIYCQLCPISCAPRQIKYFVRNHRNHNSIDFVLPQRLFLSPLPATAWIWTVRLYILFLKMWGFFLRFPQQSADLTHMRLWEVTVQEIWHILPNICNQFYFWHNVWFSKSPLVDNISKWLMIVRPPKIVFVNNRQMFESLVAYHLLQKYILKSCVHYLSYFITENLRFYEICR